MTFLITGASGFIGRALVERLVIEGSSVRVLTRNRTSRFPAPVDVRIGDLATGTGVSEALLDGVDKVLHCAGEIRRRQDMRPLHVEGTRRLVACVLGARHTRSGPMHWVQLSSCGTYGPPLEPRERVVVETTAEHPVGEYEITKTSADHVVIEAAAPDAMTLAVLRPTNVIGPGMTNTSLRRVLTLIERGLFVQIGQPGAIANYVHIDDVVSALLACACHPAARGEIFNLSSDCAWSELMEHVAATRHVRTLRVRVPEPVIRAVAAVMEQWRQSPLTLARVDALTGRTRYPAEKIEALLGFRFSKPMPHGIADLLSLHR